MEQLNTLDDVLESLDAVIRQQRIMLDDMHGASVGGVSVAPTPEPEKADVFQAEFSALFKDDKDLSALFNVAPPAEPQPSGLSPLEDLLKSLNQTPPPQPTPPTVETNNFRQFLPDPPEPLTAPPPEMLPLQIPITDEPAQTRSDPPEFFLADFKSTTAADEPAKPKLDPPDLLFAELKSKTAAERSAITDQQLRALGRKHLLMMIRDLEMELEQAKQENDNLLLAYQAGIAKKSQSS